MNDFPALFILVVVIWLIWRAVAAKPMKIQKEDIVPPQTESPEFRYMRDALEFTKSQHRQLAAKQKQQDAWEATHGRATAESLDQLSGIEFEEFLAGIFRKQGYQVELTPKTGDYGADLLLAKDGKRIAVQAKRYLGSVGVGAIQEALSGKAYYHCDMAWVATTGVFTANAIELAEKTGVRLIGRSEIGILMSRLRSHDNGD